MTKRSLLLVDDDDMLRSRLSRALAARGLRVIPAANSKEALEHLDLELPELAVIDLRMPGESGIDLLKEIKKTSPQTEAIILTGYGSVTNAVEAMRAGAVNYVTKPMDADQILAAFSNSRRSIDGSPDRDAQIPSLAEAEWNHIQRVLTDCDGNLTQAARLLQIPRRTLQRKLKKMAP